MKNKNKIRFMFIEAMLVRHGHFNREHIERAFNIGTAAASAVISDYRLECPDNIVYNRAKHRLDVVEGFEFVPQYLTIDSQTFLDAAQIMAEQQIID